MKSNSQYPPKNSGSYRNNTPDNDKGVSNENAPSYPLSSNSGNMFSRGMQDRSYSPSNGAPMSQSNRGGTTNNVMKNMSKSSPINYPLNNHMLYNQHGMLYGNNGLSKNGYGSANGQPAMHNVKMATAMRKAGDNLAYDVNDPQNKPFHAMNYGNYPGNVKGRVDENVGNFPPIPYRNVIQNNNEAVLKNGLMAPDLSSNANGGTTHSISNVNNINRINTADFISRVNAPGQLNSVMGRNIGGISATPSSNGKAFPNMNSMHGSMNMYHVKNVVAGEMGSGVPDVMMMSGNKLNEGTHGNVNKGVRHVSSNLNMNLAPFGGAHGYPAMGGSNGGRNNMHFVSGMAPMGHLNGANYNVSNLKSSMGNLNRVSASGSKNVSGYPGVLSNGHKTDDVEIMQASGNSPSSAITIDSSKTKSYRKSNGKVNPNELNEAKGKGSSSVVSNTAAMSNHHRSDVLATPSQMDQQGFLVENGKSNPNQDPYSVHGSDNNFDGNANAGGAAQGTHNVGVSVSMSVSGGMSGGMNGGANEQNVNLLNGRSFLQSAGNIPGVQDKNGSSPQYDANNVQGDKAESGKTNNVVGDPKEEANSLMNNNCVSSEKTKKRKRKEKGKEQGMEQDTPPKGTKRKSKSAQNGQTTQNSSEQTMITNSDGNSLQDPASSHLDNPVANLGNGAETINDPLNNKVSKRKLKVNSAEKAKGDEKKKKKKMMELANVGSSYPSGQPNSEVGQTSEYLTQDRNGFYISSSGAHGNMNNGVMGTHGSANYLNNPVSRSPRSDYYSSFNQDRLAEAPNGSGNWGERENIKTMNGSHVNGSHVNGSHVDGAVNPNIVKGGRYNPNVSTGNTRMNDFVNEQLRENNNAQMLRDAHLSNGGQGIAHSYVGVGANKQMGENLTHMEVQRGNNEMYKKEQLPQTGQLPQDQMKVEPKFVWLFLNKEFSENKNKYAAFLPLFNSYYPSKLNELVCKLEEYSLLSYAHVMSGAHALQRKYLGGLSLTGVPTGEYATNAPNAANTANTANAAACASSGYRDGNRDGHIDNKLLNNINSNFNELIKNFSIESGPAPKAPLGEAENAGKGRRRRKSGSSAGKAKKESGTKEKRAKKGTPTENGTGAQIDSSVNAESSANVESSLNVESSGSIESSANAEDSINLESIPHVGSSVNCESSLNQDDSLNCENDSGKVANNAPIGGTTKKPRKPRTSKKNAAANGGTTQLLINEQGQMVPAGGVQGGKAANSYFFNTNGSLLSENGSDAVNLILKSNIGNTGTSRISSNNECGFVYKEKEISIGKGMPSLCDTLSYQGNSQKDENEPHKLGGTLNDMNGSGKNGKVKKYRKKKDNNNMALADRGDIPTSAMDGTYMENEKKRKKKKNDLLSINEDSISAPNGLSTFSQNGHMSMLSDLSVEVKGNENSTEQTYPNGVEASCAGDNEDLSATYLLNCIVEDYNKEMSKRKKKGIGRQPGESKKKATTKEVVKREKAERRGKNRTKKMHDEGEEKEKEVEDEDEEEKEQVEGQMERYQNGEMYPLERAGGAYADNPYGIENSSLPTRRSKQLKKLFLQQGNLLYPLMKGSPVANHSFSKNRGLNVGSAISATNAISAIKKKYKRFSFCVNKVFRKNNMNDVIALNENLNNNRELLLLFKKRDVRNLKRLNFSFFMTKLELQKIDLIIMKRIYICAQNMKNRLGFTCVINNVEKIVDLLKKAFRDRLQLMWPLIEFSSKYRLDQYFHLLTKNRNSSQSRFKDTRLFVHQNIAPLIAYFNQRTIDDKIVEHLKSQMKPKKRRRKNKNKDPFSEDKSLDFLKTMNTVTSNNFTTENLLDFETARTKASEFAFVGYNQKRLLTQITPYDYKNILNSEFCNKLFTIKWREQQALFINHLHFDMVPDNEETRRHFEKVYMRYMGYSEEKLAVKMENKETEGKPKSKNDPVEGAKSEGKPKVSRKRKTNKSNEAAEKEPKVAKPRRKYERVKPRKSKNQSGNAEADQGVQGGEAAQNGGAAHNVEGAIDASAPSDPAAKESAPKRKARKPREQKTKSKSKNAQNNDLTVFKGNPNAVIQASLDFMNPNMFT
ncbi:hypothetical protein, conserved [Plasmodium vivax]|uniref:Uncharacterized protein n=1 Tax=Plasmodium vivax (strain Salvador I) TaxID=126793 RepID=A5K2L8_PLAVS|nr:hypothetical protein, conserved [Plasmodium vivax]EDL46668.1 hypothetical protein, conserved [Plasmodium vivax]|eukprot:XP_001616395.1 hypothetical protein [Plasmodium vivax Sal-1]